MGYDIHSHDIEQPCSPTCYTRRGGRQAQVRAMQLTSFDRTRGFLLTKTHDSMPGVNGSSMLASHRTTYFLSRGLWRQTFYEAVGRVETLLSLVAETEELGSLGLPTYMRDGYFLIFEVFESAYRAPAGDIQMPTASDRSLGLHAVHVTGQATGGGGLEFWNSWGAGWGRRGYGSVSEEYLAKYFYEGWVVRSGRWGPTEHKRVFLCESPDPRESVRAWQIQNPRQGERFLKSWRAYCYESISPTRACVVECVEVRNWIGIRAAWIFVYHDLDPGFTEPFSEITELFVWPLFRRVGLATTLERWACDRARSYGSREMRLVYNEADNNPSPLRTAGRMFGPARGYQWWWRPRIGPRAVATGVKEL